MVGQCKSTAVHRMETLLLPFCLRTYSKIYFHHFGFFFLWFFWHGGRSLEKSLEKDRVSLVLIQFGLIRWWGVGDVGAYSRIQCGQVTSP